VSLSYLLIYLFAYVCWQQKSSTPREPDRDYSPHVAANTGCGDRTNRPSSPPPDVPQPITATSTDNDDPPSSFIPDPKSTVLTRY